ncbi:MAG: flagellar brake protein [Sinimarinibacterium flocculans]|uniref:flagellar brake protein n=1 Tax=Sinimarinibacterium flocculans TaxID=985250 RepID=UPI003C58E21A
MNEASTPAADAGPTPTLLSQRERILDLLHRLRLHHELLSLRRHGSLGAHASIVLAVDPASGIDFDDPHPALHAAVGDVLSVRGRIDGSDLRFVCPVVGPSRIGGRPALRTELPTEMAMLERRAAYRVRLPVDAGITAATLDGRQGLELTDLSHLGAGAQAGRSSAIEPGDLLQLRINLPETRVDTAAEVRSSRPAGGGLRLGLRFAGLGREARQRLTQAIHRIERQLIRHARGLR